MAEFPVWKESSQKPILSDFACNLRHLGHRAATRRTTYKSMTRRVSYLLMRLPRSRLGGGDSSMMVEGAAVTKSSELRLVKKHSRAIRWMHWINFPLLA